MLRQIFLYHITKLLHQYYQFSLFSEGFPLINIKDNSRN